MRKFAARSAADKRFFRRYFPDLSSRLSRLPSRVGARRQPDRVRDAQRLDNLQATYPLNFIIILKLEFPGGFR